MQESARRKALYGLRTRASPIDPLSRLMTEESWKMQFRLFSVNTTPSSTVTDSDLKKLDLIQVKRKKLAERLSVNIHVNASSNQNHQYKGFQKWRDSNYNEQK